MSNNESKKKKVLLTRPEPWAFDMAKILREKSYQPIRFPLTQYSSLTATFPKKRFSNILITSATIFLFLEPEFMDLLKNYPLFCVGQKTKKIAKSLNFSKEIFAFPNVQKLILSIKERKKNNFLYLTGKRRRSLLENFLNENDYSFEVFELYDVVPTDLSWKYNQSISCDFIILMSSFSSFLLISLEKFLPKNVKILCFSERIFQGLSPNLKKKAIISQSATQESIIELLESLQ